MSDGDFFQRIYREEAAAYHALVSAEDRDGVLLPSLAERVPLAGARVVEVGIGTARLGRQLVGAGARVLGLDLFRPMLEEARGHLQEVVGEGSFHLVEARSEEIPVADAWADLTVAGWVLGHQRGWNPGGWRSTVARALDEMERVTRPGGVIALFETQGTGVSRPQPPPGLEEVGEFFESRSFRGRTLRTDYQFASPEEAAEVCGFFFGDALVEKILAEGWDRVPECTGFWVRTRPASERA